MRLHFVSVPVYDSAEAEAELNQFLATHRVIAMDRQLVPDGPRSTWAVCVSYVTQPSGEAPFPSPVLGSSSKRPSDPRRVDYREVLPPAEFQVFAKLRELRKTQAEREGVPPYALFTNEQLAEMVRRRARSLADLEQIDGIGPARLQKYGRTFLQVLVSTDNPDSKTDETASASP